MVSTASILSRFAAYVLDAAEIVVRNPAAAENTAERCAEMGRGFVSQTSLQRLSGLLRSIRFNKIQYGLTSGNGEA